MLAKADIQRVLRSTRFQSRHPSRLPGLFGRGASKDERPSPVRLAPRGAASGPSPFEARAEEARAPQGDGTGICASLQKLQVDATRAHTLNCAVFSQSQ